MKRKFTALLLAAVMVVSLSACSSDSSASDTDTSAEASADSTDTSGDTAEAQTATETTYPEEDIEVIVPYKVGGTTDLAVRGVLDAVSEDIIDVSITVTNEEGGSGLIGTEDFLSRDADGYTLGLVNCDLVLNYVTGATEINPSEDMIPLAAVEQDPYLLLADADAVFGTTFEEFLTYAEENPGELVVGVTGVGTIPNLLGTILSNAGLEISVVPYDSAPDAIAGVLSGEADICISAMAAAVGNIESGDLIALAVTSSERSELSPDVPTMAEVDDRFTDVNLLSWIMIALPAGSPDEAVTVLKEALSDAVASEAYAETRESFYFEEITITPDELDSFILEQAAYYETLTE